MKSTVRMSIPVGYAKKKVVKTYSETYKSAPIQKLIRFLKRAEKFFGERRASRLYMEQSRIGEFFR